VNILSSPRNQHVFFFQNDSGGDDERFHINGGSGGLRADRHRKL
jgi:hypothetical protein